MIYLNLFFVSMIALGCLKTDPYDNRVDRYDQNDNSSNQVLPSNPTETTEQNSDEGSQATGDGSNTNSNGNSSSSTNESADSRTSENTSDATGEAQGSGAPPAESTSMTDVEVDTLSTNFAAICQDPGYLGVEADLQRVLTAACGRGDFIGDIEILSTNSQAGAVNEISLIPHLNEEVDNAYYNLIYISGFMIPETDPQEVAQMMQTNALSSSSYRDQLNISEPPATYLAGYSMQNIIDDPPINYTYQKRFDSHLPSNSVLVSDLMIQAQDNITENFVNVTLLIQTENAVFSYIIINTAIKNSVGPIAISLDDILPNLEQSLKETIYGVVTGIGG